MREGIGLFLTPDLPRNDYWEAGAAGLQGYLEGHPEVRQALLEAPLETLNPTDQFYRAGLLDALGRHKEARELERAARTGLYTADYQAATTLLFDGLVELLRTHRSSI